MARTPPAAGAASHADAGRERTAARLLKISAERSYDPDVEIDWAAPLLDGVFFLPERRLTLYGTKLWEQMSHDQRVELSRCELANATYVGIWFEATFMQMLIRHSFDFHPASRHLQYAYTEVGDECRHSTMFSRLLGVLDRGPYRPNRLDYLATTLLRTGSTAPLAWAAVLLAEEIFDSMQREAMADETIQPLSRRVFRIHVVEEARHMRYAREELARIMPDLFRPRREALRLLLGHGAGMIGRALTNPRMYAEAGLDPREARAAARSNPYARETFAWSARRLIDFYQQVGLLGGAGRPLWRRSGFAT